MQSVFLQLQSVGTFCVFPFKSFKKPVTVLALTHLPKPRTSKTGFGQLIIIKEFVWIDILFFLNLAFWQVGENIKAKTAVKFEVQVKFEGLCQSTYINFLTKSKWWSSRDMCGFVQSTYINFITKFAWWSSRSEFEAQLSLKFQIRIWSATFMMINSTKHRRYIPQHRSLLWVEEFFCHPYTLWNLGLWENF